MIATCTLTYFLPFVPKQQINDNCWYSLQVLIDRFVRISIDSCCRCSTTETPLTPFFSRVSIISTPPGLVGKEIGIHRQFHRPNTGYNKCRYSIQLVDRPTGVFNRLVQGFIPTGQSNRCRSIVLHTCGQTTGRYRSKNSIHIGHSKYRSTISRAYWSQSSNRYRSTM